MSVTQKKIRIEQTPDYWLLVLLRAVRESDFSLAAEAQERLLELGVDIRFCRLLSDEVANAYGSIGTGKDHILTGLVWLAIQSGAIVEWRNGSVLFAEWRDAIKDGTPERELLKPLLKPHVLAISDPIPGRTAITDFQAEKLADLIDAR